MITVTPRSRRRREGTPDPLDGLVNLFDLGVVLSVGFLLAALESIHATSALTHRSPGDITVTPTQKTGAVPPTSSTVVGNGSQVGKVYRLSDGRLVYVLDPGVKK